MGELSFAIADLLVILVILVSAGYAAWRGLIRETLWVFAWAAAAYASLAFGPYFAKVLAGAVTAAWVRFPVAYLSMFLIVFVPLSIMSHNFSQTIQRTPIGPVDRALGFVFGIGRGLVIVSIAYIVFEATAQGRDPAWMTQSETYPLITSTTDVILSLVPDQNLGPRGTAAGPAPRPQPRQAAQRPAQPAPRPATAPQGQGGNQGTKTYGANERRALDSLIEATGRN